MYKCDLTIVFIKEKVISQNKVSLDKFFMRYKSEEGYQH